MTGGNACRSRGALRSRSDLVSNGSSVLVVVLIKR